MQVVIVKLKMDKDRKKIVERRAKGRLAALGKDKGKYTEESAASPSTVTPMETAWTSIGTLCNLNLEYKDCLSCNVLFFID